MAQNQTNQTRTPSPSAAVKPGRKVLRAYFNEAVNFGGAKAGQLSIDLTVDGVTKKPRDAWIHSIELHPAGLVVAFEIRKTGDDNSGPSVTQHEHLVYASVIKNVELVMDAEA